MWVHQNQDVWRRALEPARQSWECSGLPQRPLAHKELAGTLSPENHPRHGIRLSVGMRPGQQETGLAFEELTAALVALV